MITLTKIQKMVLVESLEKMEDNNQPDHPATAVLGMVNNGVIDPHRMNAEQLDALTEAINHSDFHQQLLDAEASDQQMMTVISTMNTLVSLLSMYCVRCHFKTESE